MKKQQQKIEMILQKNYKGNEVKYIDVSADEDAKEKMRALSGNPTAVPPQIFNGDTYCGVSAKEIVFESQDEMYYFGLLL